MRSSSLIHAGRARKTKHFSLCRSIPREDLERFLSCEKLTEKDFMYFRPSQSVLREEERLDALCEKPLLDFDAGKLLPEVISKEIADKKIIKAPTDAGKSDGKIVQERKPNLQSASSDKSAKKTSQSDHIRSGNKRI